MKVHLAELGDAHLDAPVEKFAVLLDTQTAGRHVRADPVDADVILFTQCHMLAGDWRLTRIAKHPLCMQYPEKIYVYDERDRPWLRFPGMYVSMPARQFRRRWQVATSYYGMKPQTVNNSPAEDNLLFTFVGSPTARCREAIYALHHPRSYVERVTRFRFYDPSSAGFMARKQHFAEIMARSKFVLCPRGRGTSSIRLYETLAAARVPVILSDAWVPPNGPRWEQFTIRWPEGGVAELPAYLESREADVPELVRRGSDEFNRWFAPDRMLAVRLDELEQVVQARHELRFPSGGYRDRAWLVAARTHYEARARGTLLPVMRRLRPALNRSHPQR